jgi:hypothetical protein
MKLAPGWNNVAYQIFPSRAPTPHHQPGQGQEEPYARGSWAQRAAGGRGPAPQAALTAGEAARLSGLRDLLLSQELAAAPHGEAWMGTQVGKGVPSQLLLLLLLLLPLTGSHQCLKH